MSVAGVRVVEFGTSLEENKSKVKVTRSVLPLRVVCAPIAEIVAAIGCGDDRRVHQPYERETKTGR